MNRKQFILLLFLAALIGSAGLVVYQRSNGSWESAGAAIGQKLIPGFALNDVAQITIQTGTNVLHLARVDDLWRVQDRAGYPANFSQISDFLQKVSNLKIIQNEEVGPSQLGRFELLPPVSGTGGGTLVEFKDQDGKVLSSILLGKKHLKQSAAAAASEGMDGGGWPDGRYVMAGTDSKEVAVISDPLENAQPQPQEWLNKDLFTILNPRAISVQFPVPTNSWKLTRLSETNDWQLADARPSEKLDSSKVSGVTSPFSSVSFNDVASLAANPQFAGSTSNSVITVETFDGLAYLANVGSPQDGSYPVSFVISGNPSTNSITLDKLAKGKQFQNWVYYLPSYSLDEILKPRNQLLVVETNTVATAPAK